MTCHAGLTTSQGNNLCGSVAGGCFMHMCRASERIIGHAVAVFYNSPLQHKPNMK